MRIIDIYHSEYVQVIKRIFIFPPRQTTCALLLSVFLHLHLYCGHKH